MKKRKNIILLPIAFLITVAIAITAVVASNNRVNYDNLTEVRIKKYNAMSMRGVEYKLVLKHGVWAVYYTETIPYDENVGRMVVHEEFVNRITRVLAENKAHKWDGYEKSPYVYISDGSDFAFYMCFSDGTEIEFESYGTGPKNFYVVLEEFEKQYTGLFAQ